MMTNFDTDHLSPAEQLRLAEEFAKSIDTTGLKPSRYYDGRYDDNKKDKGTYLGPMFVCEIRYAPLRDQDRPKIRKKLQE